MRGVFNTSETGDREFMIVGIAGPALDSRLRTTSCWARSRAFSSFWRFGDFRVGSGGRWLSARRKASRSFTGFEPDRRLWLS